MIASLALRLVIAVGGSAAITWIALRRRALSASGALAALVVGLVIGLGGGPAWFAALGAFFVTSTLLGRVGRARKEATKREFEKGDTRDAWQVIANGGVATVAAALMGLAPDARWAAAFLGALATANGDTWATELGVLSRGEPWSLVGLRRVPRGTSGAVSPLGLGATTAGAALIGLVAACAPAAFALGPGRALVVATVGGVCGSLTDSLLGATLQAGYHCPACDRATEGRRHHCGATTAHRRGVRVVDNDVVNLLATLAGAAVAALVYTVT